ncbi:MAG: spermidine/putrescine transport system permease protein [Alteromonas naphthalenivorans]|jgi:spermidine/putrescine transport system permease protein
MFKNAFERLALPLWVSLTYLFLYIPIIVLIVFSFNSIAFPYHWESFSLHWYHELFAAADLWKAAYNSLFVGLSTVFLSLVISLFFVMWNASRKDNFLLAFFYPNLVVPEIILAVGLLSFFIFFNVPLTLGTLIVGHTLLGLGYAIPILHESFSSIDERLVEASLDLGATSTQTFFKIIIPILTPSLIAAGLLVFILSLDDFLIAFFCAGSGSQTLSLYIFAMIRTGVSPEVNALATLMIVVSSLLVFLFCSVRVREQE